MNKVNLSHQLIQRYILCLWLIYCLLYGSYLILSGSNRAYHGVDDRLKVGF